MNYLLAKKFSVIDTVLIWTISYLLSYGMALLAATLFMLLVLSAGLQTEEDKK